MRPASPIKLTRRQRNSILRKWMRMRSKMSPDDWRDAIETRIKSPSVRASVACVVFYDMSTGLFGRGWRDALAWMMEKYDVLAPATGDEIRAGLSAIGYPQHLSARRVYEGDR